MTTISFLKGKRLYLRPLTKEDVPFLLRTINSEEVRVFLNAYLPTHESEELAWVEERAKNKQNNIVFGIVLRDGDQLIGTIGIHQIRWKDRTAITGTAIGEKINWNKGYGTEAKILLLRYAFDDLGLRQIYSHVLSFNGRSRRYGEKCGYRLVATFPKYTMKRGKFCDELILMVDKGSFRKALREMKKKKTMKK